MSKGKYYITTAIAYTSGKPHIGNCYEIVLADAIARYKRADGYDVYFLTGSGEHSIGHAKMVYLEQSVGEDVFGLMEEIKAVFDPDRILNPGKVCDRSLRGS